eukprot:gnl/MRDRNA2_/MRDRNA2_14651_c0_seq1.p1 gnl/MRDRNA2_/MRDRNA2_14651_c0~~gnl/MRDRNA2_/MRDRNA2_14651_c0_seq1.p1  ORF type:complete len:331 (-),score=73.35 gnl/MRDRNA2_/MRDRNA2_14651_c0_seq1:41-1033(-)
MSQRLRGIETSEMYIPRTVKFKPFNVPEGRCGHVGSFGDIMTSPSYQSFHLTEFSGASLVVDVQASGSQSHPQFQCRLRIAEINKEIPAIARHDLFVSEEPQQNIGRLTVQQIKARLQERGESQDMRGKTRKEELLAVLRASDERHRQAKPGKLVAKAGQTGVVVEPLHTNSEGEERIGVSFKKGNILYAFPRSVELREAVPSKGKDDVYWYDGSVKFGQATIGDESTYQITGGSITFKKPFGADGHEYFVSSPPTPAVPGVLVPWRKDFQLTGNGFNRQIAPLFKTDAEVECDVVAKLQMTFKHHSFYDHDDLEFETPEPKAKRLRGSV